MDMDVRGNMKDNFRKFCCVPGCAERLRIMFLFPKNRDLRDYWRSVCKIERNISNFMSVCCLHFSTTDVELTMTGRKRLKKGAVPSRNLPLTVHRKGRRNCIVDGCEKNLGYGVTLHFFPKNHLLRMRWMSLCKMVNVPSRNTRICSQHFCEEDFRIHEKRGKTLKTGVSPSVNLPSSSLALHTFPKSKLYTVMNSCCVNLEETDSEGSVCEEVDIS